MFRPRFDDAQLEAAWHEERLKNFMRVNQRALVVCLGVSVIFAILGMVYVDSDRSLLFARVGLVVLVLAAMVALTKFESVKRGDPFVAIASVTGLSAAWFTVFLELPEQGIRDWWLVTLALFEIALLILLDLPLLLRLAATGAVFLLGLTVPSKLDMEWKQGLSGMSHVLVVVLVAWVGAWQVEVSRRLAFARWLEAKSERERTVDLLRNILPESIAERLLQTPDTIAERHPRVTVLFVDIVGFTPWAATRDAHEVVVILDRIFSAFDALCDEHRVEKIKTIGDAYMAAGGVFGPNAPASSSVVRLALDMIDAVEAIELPNGATLQLRAGIHEGPVVAGVIGRRKFVYDLWGDTVNTAARMESHGIAGSVQVTENVAQQLGEEFVLQRRGMVELKGKGKTLAFLVRRMERSSDLS